MSHVTRVSERTKRWGLPVPAMGPMRGQHSPHSAYGSAQRSINWQNAANDGFAANTAFSSLSRVLAKEGEGNAPPYRPVPLVGGISSTDPPVEML
jgi:hypothetical protein